MSRYSGEGSKQVLGHLENCGKCRSQVCSSLFRAQWSLCANVTHCFDSQPRFVSNIQAFGNSKLLPKHYFKLTATGSGDLLTRNRVSRQNVCVGGGNVSVFYVYVRCCNLSNKGALIDTFGRHSPAGSEGRGCYTKSACSTQTQNESLSSNGLQNIQSSVNTRYSKYHPAQQQQVLDGFSHLAPDCKAAILARSARAEPVFAGIRTVSALLPWRAGPAAMGPQCKICFSIWLTFELIAQQPVIWVDWVNIMWKYLMFLLVKSQMCLMEIRFLDKIPKFYANLMFKISYTWIIF